MELEQLEIFRKELLELQELVVYGTITQTDLDVKLDNVIVGIDEVLREYAEKQDSNNE